MRKWLDSRAVRTFRKRRLAVCMLGVIGVYVLIGIAAATGVISARAQEQRVGPDTQPGLFGARNPEKRLADSGFHLDRFERALLFDDWAEGRKFLAMGALRAGGSGRAETAAAVAAARAEFENLAVLDELDERPELLPAIASLEDRVRALYAPLTGWSGLMHRASLLAGTDRQGRAIFVRALGSVRVALQVGLVVGLLAVSIGSVLGAMAAYFGGWVDHAVIWLYSTLSSVPNLVLLAVLVYVFSQPFVVFGTEIALGQTLFPVYIALAATYWIGPCRLVRGEVLKIKELEYIQAARATGFRQGYIVLRHVLPNTAHLMLINFSLLFIGAVKSEVILTFLGLGVKEGASWGIMIGQSGQEVVNGFFWQIGAATAAMFGLVLAFNIVTDTMQDAFDPKHVE